MLSAARGSSGALPSPYLGHNPIISPLDRDGWSAFSWYDSVSMAGSVFGYSSAWNATGESPSSRRTSDTAAARLAPELSPTTASGRASTPISPPWAASQRTTPTASSSPAGYGCSRGRRYG